MRQRNEDVAVLGDQCLRDVAASAEWPAGEPRPFLAAVLDGMGGHQAGAEASALVAARLSGAAHRWWAGCSAAELSLGLRQVLANAHRELEFMSRTVPGYAACGTTCTALLVAPQALLLAHVGDSRCYRRRAGLWKQLTQDHAIVQKDAEGSLVSRLIHAVGGGRPELPPDLTTDLTDMCFPGDVFLLVTDGVLAAAGDEAAAEQIFEAPDARGVLDLALAKGAPDNATVVRLEFLE
jgi:protein phosphatase